MCIVRPLALSEWFVRRRASPAVGPSASGRPSRRRLYETHGASGPRLGRLSRPSCSGRRGPGVGAKRSRRRHVEAQPGEIALHARSGAARATSSRSRPSRTASRSADRGSTAPASRHRINYTVDLSTARTKPVTGSPDYDSTSGKRIDAEHDRTDAQARRQGRSRPQTREVSADGKTMTDHDAAGRTRTGRRSTTSRCYEKQ